ncbi:DUF4493 domain-containing protein [Phocaeicola plebeius]|uniref:DUF4493 domain-containing protein n=1 Tax=Phocaeicola plebeius TaxID=310297 RepID=UPI0026EADB61|nr:DUF4493 domain-containing protein [Phocaeicola plebeius]
MKKIFLICLTLFAGILVFTACHSEAMEGQSTGKGELNLASITAEVITEVETVDLGSRAESGTDLSNYVVAVYNAQSEKVNQWKYSEMPEIISLAVGSYTVEVASAEAPTNGFDIPYYKGSTTCEIKENEIVDVPAITCKLANMMFSVEYDEEFKSKMGEDVVTTITVGDNSLEIPSSETRKAYLVAPGGETTSVTVTLKGTIDGEVIDYSERFDVKTGVHNVIKYDFVPVSDGTGDGSTLKVAINVDSSLTGSDEVIGVNPGEEPGIDDFPEDGGEEPGDGDGETGEDAIRITGKDLGGSTFDIDQTQTVTGEISLIVGIEASAGIQSLKVKITSTNEDFNGIGESLGEFDLAHSNTMEPETKDMLAGLGLPLDEKVLNQVALDFDISGFTKLLLGFDGTHTFKISVTDNQGNQLSKSLIVNVPEQN